jgi:hypothetical protein
MKGTNRPNIYIEGEELKKEVIAWLRTGKVWKKAVVAHLKVLSWNSPGETEENYKNRRLE